MGLKAYVCKQCGAPINVAKMQCEYCGTKFHDESLKNLVFVPHTPGVAKIIAKVEVAKELVAVSPESARAYSLRELRNQIADGLLAFMKLEASEENLDAVIIRGEVRVIEPAFTDI